jgi:hypothetical protein
MSQVIREAYEKLIAERDAIIDNASELAKNKEEKLAAYRAAEEAYNAATEAYKNATQPRLFEVSNEIAAMARMLPEHVKAPQ